MPELVEPNLKYKDSYIEALREYKEVDGDSIDIEDRENNFDKFLDKLEKNKKAHDGLTPNFQFWSVIGDRYIGRINYRPELDDKLRIKGGNAGYSVRPSERGKGYATLMMQQIIEKAKEDGLKELLISCNSDNIQSIKVIEKCGGQYVDGGLDENNVQINRYIINL